MPNAKNKKQSTGRKKVQREAAFSFAIYLIRHWPALGTFYSDAFPPSELMAKSILPEISFCGRRVWWDLCYVLLGLSGVGGDAKLGTYLALGARHALVPRVLCLTGRPLAPHGDSDAGVSEYEHQQRHDELQREQRQRVVVILSTLWPNFAANVSDVDVRQAGRQGRARHGKDTE